LMTNMLSIKAGGYFFPKREFSNSVGSLKPQLHASREGFTLAGIYVGIILDVLTFHING